MSPSGARRFGVGSAMALVAANMIGAGAFTTSGYALADLGSREAVLCAWAVGGVIALCGAFSYARLAVRIPENGGEYLFLARSVHPLAGFLAGWISLWAGFTAPIAVAAHAFEAYAQSAFDLAGPPGLLGSIAILLAGMLHGFSRERGALFQNIAVIAKALAILLLIVFGAHAIAELGPRAPEPARVAFSVAAFATSLVWISFAYSGWNAAVYVSGELRDPERTLPRALLLGTLGVVAAYLALNAVFLWSAPIEALSGRAEVGAIAAMHLGGERARQAISAIVMLGLLTSISAMAMVGPRVYAQMARDGLFPRALAPPPESGTPSGAVALQIVLALGVFWAGDLRDLLLYVGFLLGLSAAATVACLFVGPSADRVRPGGSLVSWLAAVLFIVATLGSAGFMLWREPEQLLAGGVTLSAGIAVYGFFKWRPPVRADS